MKPALENSSAAFPALFLAAMIAGCAAKQAAEPPDPRLGEVKARVLAADDGNTYSQPQPGEGYFGPFEFDDNVTPLYPAALLAQNLPPSTVRVRVIVDENGSVTACQPLTETSGSPPEFYAATRDAVLRWRFDPLVKMEGGAGRTTITYHGMNRHFGGKATALPFHQDYEFTFSQRDGKGTVSSSKGQ